MAAILGGEIERLDRLRPNDYAWADKVGWLSALDGRIQEQLLGGTGDFSGYGPETEGEQALLIQGPYADIYLKWLTAQVDLNNLEGARYSASQAAFEAGWAELARWLTRTRSAPARYIRNAL